MSTAKHLSLWLFIQVALLRAEQADSVLVNKTIRVGYLAAYFSSRVGAFNVAIERAQSEGMLQEYNFRYTIPTSAFAYVSSLVVFLSLLYTIKKQIIDDDGDDDALFQTVHYVSTHADL